MPVRIETARQFVTANKLENGRVVTVLVTLLIPAALRMHCGGADKLAVDARSVRQALDVLRSKHVALVQHLLTRDGELRPFVKVFVRSNDVRDLGGLDTPLNDGDTVAFVASVAGG